MALTVWQRAQLQATYSPEGVHENGEPRYSRNNFDVMRWQEPGATVASEWVVSPVADSGQHMVDVNAGTLGVLPQHFGFYDYPPMLIEQHRTVGDGDGVFDLHFFGPV